MLLSPVKPLLPVKECVTVISRLLAEEEEKKGKKIATNPTISSFYYVRRCRQESFTLLCQAIVWMPESLFLFHGGYPKVLFKTEISLSL